jgi:hypothetical protein
VGFLVAFFFIVLFSLGLDLDADVPGFFFTGMHIPPLGTLLPDEHQNLPLSGIIEMCYVAVKRLAPNFKKKF